MAVPSQLNLLRPETPLSDGVVALRPWTLADVGALVTAIDGDGEIARWLELIPQPYREAEARAWVERATTGWGEGTMAAFASFDVDGGTLAGGIGVEVKDAAHAVVEVGYWAACAARGRGVTTRAVRLVSRWALEQVGAERFQLRAERENLASQRVAEKAGFVREGVLRSTSFNPRLGRRMDFVMYSMLPSDPPNTG